MTRTPRPAPDVHIADRRLEPQEAISDGQLAEAERLVAARLARGIFDYASGEVRFKDARLVGRWFNEAVSPQQIYRAKLRGWIPVRPDMLVDLEQLGVSAVSADGYVVRGQRGEEHLLCLPEHLLAAINKKKTEENLRHLGSTARVRATVAEAAAREYGPEAGEFIARGTIGEVTDSRERIERLEGES